MLVNIPAPWSIWVINMVMPHIKSNPFLGCALKAKKGEQMANCGWFKTTPTSVNMGLRPQPVMQRHFDAASQGRLSVDEISVRCRFLLGDVRHIRMRTVSIIMVHYIYTYNYIIY